MSFSRKVLPRSARSMATPLIVSWRQISLATLAFSPMDGPSTAGTVDDAAGAAGF